MEAEQVASKKIEIIQGRPIVDVLGRAIRHALLQHKRAGNTIAVWDDGRVVLIPAAEIQVADEETSPRDER